MTNLTYELVKPTAQANSYATLLWIIAAIAVVAFWGPGRLTRRELRSVRQTGVGST